MKDIQNKLTSFTESAINDLVTKNYLMTKDKGWKL